MQQSSWRYSSNSFPPGGVPWLYLQLSQSLVLFLSFGSRKSALPSLVHFSLSLGLRKKVTRWFISLWMTRHTLCHPGWHTPSVDRYCSLSSSFLRENFPLEAKGTSPHLCRGYLCVCSVATVAFLWGKRRALSALGKHDIAFQHFHSKITDFSNATEKTFTGKFGRQR